MNRRLPLGIIILAAGRGKRMKSSLPKVLHRVGGKPMLHHVLLTAKALDPDKIVVIVGNGMEEVSESLEGEDVTVVLQGDQLGTGHAVLQARREFSGFDGNILVLSGDVPLLRQITLDKLISKHYVSEAAATMLTTIFDNPTGYGRIIRNGVGSLDRVVEEKDCPDELKVVTEVNAGVYVFDASLLFQYLPQVNNDNAQQEYLLPDVLPLMKSSGQSVALHQISESRQVAGVNSQEQLAEVKRIYGELYAKDG